MNKSYKDATIVTITLNGVTDNLQYFNVNTKKWEVISNDNSTGDTTFDVKLQAGGGKLFSLKN